MQQKIKKITYGAPPAPDPPPSRVIPLARSPSPCRRRPPRPLRRRSTRRRRPASTRRGGPQARRRLLLLPPTDPISPSPPLLWSIPTATEVSTALWAHVLYYAVEALLWSGHEGVYAAIERPLQLAQTAAVLEILHGLVGLVRSPVSATLPQIGSLLFVTWGILWNFHETRTHILLSSLVINWSITES